MDNPDETPEEELQRLLQEGENIIRALEANRARLTAEGHDVDAKIASARARMKEFADAHRACEKADENLLQSTANLADAERAVFEFIAPIVDAKHEETPFDPKIQELKKQVDEWRKHMPKGSNPPPPTG